MNRLFSARSLIASAIALAAVVAGSAAHARTDVTLVVDLNASRRHAQPAPVFVQHQPVPLHARPTATPPQPVQFGHDDDRFHRFDRLDRRGGARGDADRDGVPNRFDRDSRWYDARATQRHVRWGDFDRDGVVNQFDRAPRNPRRY
jgi:hypothetical protein